MKLARLASSVIGLSAALAGLAGSRSSEGADDVPGDASTPRRTRYVVAAMGDSLTDARSGGGKYLDVLRARCPGSQFDNFGHGGEMVSQMRARFARDILGSDRPASARTRYTHVIVFGGVNDIGSDQTAKRTVQLIRADLQGMYDSARQHGIRVIALTIAPWGGFRHSYNERRASMTLAVNRWIRGRSPSRGVDFVVDAYALLSCGNSERLCSDYVPPFNDELHFNRRGHEVLAKALYEGVFRDCL